MKVSEKVIKWNLVSTTMIIDKRSLFSKMDSFFGACAAYISLYLKCLRIALCPLFPSHDFVSIINFKDEPTIWYVCMYVCMYIYYVTITKKQNKCKAWKIGELQSKGCKTSKHQSFALLLKSIRPQIEMTRPTAQ